MTTLRTAAQQALEALEEYQYHGAPFLACDGAIDALRAALAQKDEPSQSLPIRATVFDDAHPNGIPLEQWVRPGHPPQRKPQTLDDAMQQPRVMAQAYENGYKAGAAAEREACAQVCEARFMGDMTREDMEARRCAAAIRARGVQS